MLRERLGPLWSQGDEKQPEKGDDDPVHRGITDRCRRRFADLNRRAIDEAKLVARRNKEHEPLAIALGDTGLGGQGIRRPSASLFRWRKVSPCHIARRGIRERDLQLALNGWQVCS